MASNNPAKFITIPELLAISEPSQAGLLRIIGRLERHDIIHNIVWIQDHQTPSLHVAVEVSNVEPFPFKVGVLYQFIGEADYRDVPDTDVSKKCVLLKALLCRCMDGLDMDIYLRSHEARMADLKRI